MSADQRLDLAFDELRRQSKASLLLMLVGVVFVLGSIWYAATRLRPLEEQIAAKRAQVQRLADEEAAQRRRVAALQQEYDTLKANAEKLYAVRVTPENEVYELKATAQATGNSLGGKPEYRFEIYVKSPPQTLESIAGVSYRFDHPTFRRKLMTSDNAGDRFAVAYEGWGCLSRVGIAVALKDGTRHAFDFDMCRSLGPGWGSERAVATTTAPSKMGPLPAAKRDSRVKPGSLRLLEQPNMPVERAAPRQAGAGKDDGG